MVTTYSRELEIVVYCACPNEESAAVAAKHLKQAGLRKYDRFWVGSMHGSKLGNLSNMRLPLRLQRLDR